MPVHIATSSDIGRAARRALRVPVHFVPDNLLVGPCAAEPDAHLEARARYWDFNRGERARFRASSRTLMEAIASRPRLVIWTSRLWSDVVALWSFCAWRLHRWPLKPRIDVIVLGAPSDHAFGRGSLRVTSAELRRGLDEVRPHSLTRAKAMALFWRTLASRTPVLASRVRLGRGREDLVTIGTYHAAFYPRLDASRLVLSRFDHLLFSCVEDQWRTPLDVLMRRGAGGAELREWSNHTGDLFIASRLREWAVHDGACAAFESRSYRPERHLLECQYKLSAVGEKILRDGFDDLAQGAPLPVGGGVAYAPAAPWALRDDGRLVRM